MNIIRQKERVEVPGELNQYGMTRMINIPAIGKCSCGEEVILSGFTNTCECGIDYDINGHRLAPRSQWGEETGEHWSDCY